MMVWVKNTHLFDFIRLNWPRKHISGPNNKFEKIPIFLIYVLVYFVSRKIGIFANFLFSPKIIFSRVI